MVDHASGPAPVLFGGGYVTLGERWRAGFVAAAATIVIWTGVGAVRLQLLGHW